MELILLPHQDDEFGCFKLIEQLAVDPDNLLVVYLTTGAPPGERAEHRNHESLAVLRQLGVPHARVLFLGEMYDIADGFLWQGLETAYRAICSELGNDAGIRGVLTPAWEGGHQDHDACYLIACALARRFNCEAGSRQFSLYHGNGLPSVFFRVLSPLPENGLVSRLVLSWGDRLRYLRLCLSYRSQRRTWMGLLPFVCLKYLLNGCQESQPLSLARLESRPHPGVPLYERRGFCRQVEFERAQEQFLGAVF